MKKLVALALAGAVTSTAAFALSDDFKITATVAEKCVINTNAADISVNYDPFITSDYTDSTNIVFNCVKGTSGTISWTASGVLSSTDPAISDTLSYSLSATLNGSSINSGDAFTDSNGIGSGNEEILSFDITIPAQQNVNVGTYEDTVTVNIVY
ncbi:MAG TPA: hypothetical protein DEP48_07310 [Persephonella sp.]|uniref:VCBS protein n=1 Tax=Persephonella marina (strain DSM 14350 / EX-H1) TaxID=123214 RepID=C0QU67_PERMH|nr:MULTISPECIES: spore coat protein U domain-containing protein [Persephonella]ACO04461.1 VCBS protein [Persephonella marina EX-H1]HCB70152.1 hypothetical protein [Persephonella sp.]